MVDTPLTEPGSTGDASERHERALRIVGRYVLMSSAAGLIPLPGLDVTVLAGIHIALIKEISEHYGVAFSEHTARNIIVAVATSIVPGSIASFAGRRLLRALRFVTPSLGLLTMSASSAAVSYALGRVFMAHFETGGTLDSFDVENLHKLMWWKAAPAFQH